MLNVSADIMSKLKLFLAKIYSSCEQCWPRSPVFKTWDYPCFCDVSDTAKIYSPWRQITSTDT